MATVQGADAHDATDFAKAASTFALQGYGFIAQYIDQFSDANTGGSPSVTKAEIQQETSAGLSIVSIFQTNGMSSSTGAAYQTYFTASQGAADAQEAITSAQDLGQPPGSTIYFAMDFDPAVYGAAGSEANLLAEVRSYLGAVGTALDAAGYNVGVYGAGDTLAAAIRTLPPVAQYGWLTQSYGWAGSNPQSDANAQGWNIYQSAQTTQNGVAIDPDTAESSAFGEWTVCFCAGTGIQTTRGDVAVEDLKIGDLVVTASGEQRPVKWLGHRTMDCRRTDNPRGVYPVRVAAHAFGADRPNRDLWLSPGHAVCLDVVGEVFVPVSSLINGSTVAQVDTENVTYCHVELDSHDVLVANGQPAESYVDVGNRGFFSSSRTAATPDRPPGADLSKYCRPFHEDGPLVEVMRAQLKLRAATLGWRLEEAPLGGIHLQVDGARVEPETEGLLARFVVTADAREVWLVSSAVVPSHMEPINKGDDRALGLCIKSLRIESGREIRRMFTFGDYRLAEGFHKTEIDHRWTNGRARLPATLWQGCQDRFVLHVQLHSPALPRWVGPAERARSLGHAA